MNGVMQSLRIFKQKGVIVQYHGFYKASTIFSPFSGYAMLGPHDVCPLMKLGSFVRYNIYQQMNVWHACDVEYVGEELEIIPYLMRAGRLQLSVFAVMNRVDKKTCNAWMWNDTIGRIFVPPYIFRDTLNPFDVVQVTVMYEGEHEDVPWAAVRLIPIQNGIIQEFFRPYISSGIFTCDGWTVDKCEYSSKKKCPYYTTLYHKNMNVYAFAAWTDYIHGEEILRIGDHCMVTWVRQNFIGKLGLRAIVVTVIKYNAAVQE